MSLNHELHLWPMATKRRVARCNLKQVRIKFDRNKKFSMGDTTAIITKDDIPNGVCVCLHASEQATIRLTVK